MWWLKAFTAPLNQSRNLNNTVLLRTQVISESYSWFLILIQLRKKIHFYKSLIWKNHYWLTMTDVIIISFVQHSQKPWNKKS